MDDDLRRLTDAVLYEGYVLWPYRRSALKNQRRWTFGGVHPPAHAAAHPDDRGRVRTECLLVVDDPETATVEVAVRFLHVVRRDVQRATPAGREPVDVLEAGGARHVAWEEATEREVATGALGRDELLGGRAVPVAVAPGSAVEVVAGADGREAGAIVRRWERLTGRVEVRAREAADGVLALGVAIVNTSPFGGGSRQDALRQTFCSAHAVLRAGGGCRFVSRTDPPAALRPLADACVDDGLWPVLAGPPGAGDVVLASPIILEDHPRIAPESPGDLFDGGEIDQLLTLSILAMTDEEKADMRDADPRTRAILERTEALTGEQLMALHGRLHDPRGAA